jgi:two-component system, LytTR family, response regulator
MSNRPILVYIDDEEILCSTFKLIFKNYPLDLVTFTNPLDGIEYLNSHKVNFVLCDYRMPMLNGVEVIRALGECPPFYLLSGDIQLEVGEEQGIKGVLRKPIQLDALLKIIGEYIELK